MPDLPLPQPDEHEQPFWDYVRSGELRIQRCAECSRLRHPPRPMCPHCGSLQSEWALASGRGTVYSYIVTHQPIHPALQGRVPFATVLVELEEGVLLTSNMVDCPADEIEIGMTVAVTFAEINDAVTLPLFQRVQHEGEGPTDG